MARLRRAAARVRKHEAERIELAAAIVEARRIGWRPVEIKRDGDVPYDRNHITRILNEGGIEPTRGPRAKADDADA